MSSFPPSTPRSLDRRAFLGRAAMGFGGFAAGALQQAWGLPTEGPLAPRAPHHPARARSVIFLYMDGGPSQVDTFDPKPRLEREHGQPIQMETPPTQFDNVGAVLKSPWAFKRHGASEIPISSLFPNLATVADELCVVRSMTSKFPEHTFANYFLHTGHGIQGRPSMGAWTVYGLGNEAEDLPGYVVLDGGLTPPGGLDCYGSGYLPASFQGSVLKPTGRPMANLEGGGGRRRARLDLAADLDRLSGMGEADAVSSAIQNQELAWRMQAAVPEAFDIAGESRATRELYGVDSEARHTASYARQCLLARRLVERGVRFVQLTCPSVGHDRWDQHNNLKGGHEDNARAVDQPIAALLRDLRARGLLESTLVLFAGEFGRTPMAQGSNGRDHNPHGFSIWLAGGGVKAGSVHGATDDYGYFAISQRAEIHDLHATMLHLLGFDHTRLTVRHSGRDMRLTDVHGHVQDHWLA